MSRCLAPASGRALGGRRGVARQATPPSPGRCDLSSALIRCARAWGWQRREAAAWLSTTLARRAAGQAAPLSPGRREAMAPGAQFRPGALRARLLAGGSFVLYLAMGSLRLAGVCAQIMAVDHDLLHKYAVASQVRQGGQP